MSDELLDSGYECSTSSYLCLCPFFLLLISPWCAATILSWVYYDQCVRGGSCNSQLALSAAVIQTSSGLLYILFIPIAVMCIGMAGRRSSLSFCCLCSGILLFGVIPAVTGLTSLLALLTVNTTMTNGMTNNINKTIDTTAIILGGVTGGLCLISTTMCCCIVCMALACGSWGRGKNHRYPIPLAYLPFLSEFVDVEESIHSNRPVRRFTLDYLPKHSNRKKRET